MFSSSINPNLFQNFSTQNFLPSSFQPNFLVPLPFLNSNFSLPVPASLPIPASLSPQELQGSLQQRISHTLMIQKLQTELKNQLMKTQVYHSHEAPTRNVQPYLSLQKQCQAIAQDVPVSKSVMPSQYLPQLCDPNKSTKAHLKDMIYFILENFDNLSEEEVKMEKLKYRNNKDLSMVFDALLSKYLSSVKTKEETMKYILKTSVKFMQQKTRKGTEQTFSSQTQKRSFNALLKEMSGKIHEDSDEQESSNKTTTTYKRSTKSSEISPELMTEAFSSGEFYQGFQEYLKNSDQILELDNNKRIDKFLRFIEGAMRKNAIKDIKKYKRIPWLKSWIQTTKKVAYEFFYSNQSHHLDEDRKIVKKEEYSSDYKESSESYFSAKIEETSI